MLSKIISQGFANAVNHILFRNTKLFFYVTEKAAGTSKIDSQAGLMSDYQLQESNKLSKQVKSLRRMVINLTSAIHQF